LLLCDVTRRILVAGNRRFVTTSSKIKQSKNPLHQGVGPTRFPEMSVPTNKGYWPSKIGPSCLPETSAPTNKYWPSKIGPSCCPETSVPTNKDCWPSKIGPSCCPETSVPTNKDYWPSKIGPSCPETSVPTRTTGPRKLGRHVGPKRRHQLTRTAGPRKLGRHVGPKRRYQITSFVDGEHTVKKKRIINFVQNLRTCLLANF